jgi:hypothetical protein
MTHCKLCIQDDTSGFGSCWRCALDGQMVHEDCGCDGEDCCEVNDE